MQQSCMCLGCARVMQHNNLSSSDKLQKSFYTQNPLQVLALARKMRNGRSKNDILDGAYHRYSFHDDDLPRWLYEDEKRHLRCAYPSSQPLYPRRTLCAAVESSACSESCISVTGRNFCPRFLFMKSSGCPEGYRILCAGLVRKSLQRHGSRNINLLLIKTGHQAGPLAVFGSGFKTSGNTGSDGNLWFLRLCIQFVQNDCIWVFHETALAKIPDADGMCCVGQAACCAVQGGGGG